MSNGHAQLDAMSAAIRGLAPALARDAAPKIAKAVERELGAQIARGVDPDGKPWPLTLEGRPALRGAADALSVRAVDGAIVARLTGPEALHNRGAVRGGMKRQILPAGPVPGSIADAITEVLDAEFAAQTDGAR